MYKNLIKNLSFLFIINLLVKTAWVLGIEVGVQNRLGTEQYGIYYTLVNLSMMFSFLPELGLSRYNAVNVARHEKIMESEFFSLLQIKFLLSLVYLVFTFLIGNLLSYSTFQLYLLLLLALCQVFGSFILLLRSNLSGMQLFKADGFFSVFDKFLALLACVLLLSGFSGLAFTAEIFVYVQFFCLLGSLLLISFVVIGKIPRTKLTFSWQYLRHLLVVSFPFTLLVSLEMLQFRSGVVILERTAGAMQSGLYANAFRLLEAFIMFASLLGVVLLPIFAKMLDDKSQLSKMIRFSLGLILLPVLALVSTLLIFEKQVLLLLYKIYTIEMGSIYRLNVLTFLPFCIIYVTQPLLTVSLRLRELNLIWFLGLLLVVAGNGWTTTRFGALGTSAVYLISSTVIALGQLWVVYHKNYLVSTNKE
ncbi:MAG: oligosaccharide flippase family protein [Verrucomicrobia bacterium]|nr:oligosaccharide flippase family protein [Cytophagales bacterium]